MNQDQILFPKRSRPVQNQNQDLEINSEPRKLPLRAINWENSPKMISENEGNKMIWTQRDQEDLIASFFQKIINEPYLSFTWNGLRDQRSLAKISGKLMISQRQCLRKINQIESVHEQKHSGLKVVDFLIVYWKSQNFDGKTGRDLIEKIKESKDKKSNHMEMLDQKMEMRRGQQSALDNLFELVMRG